MKVETVHVPVRNPYHDQDPGECTIVHYTVNGADLQITDADGHRLRFKDGELCAAELEPGDDPRQCAARLGRMLHRETDRGPSFWKDISRINGKEPPV